MEDGDWDGGGKAIGMYLNGHGIAGTTPAVSRSSTTTSCSTSTPTARPR